MRISMENPHNILIIRFSSIGDVLLATPLIRILREKFPNASIDFIVRREYAELLQHNPYLSHLIVFDSSEGFKSLRKLKNELKHASYDIVLDIHNSIRSRYLRKCLRFPVRTIHKRILQRFLLIHCKWNFYNGIVPVAERYLETASCLGIENDGKGLDIFLPQEINARVETQLREDVKSKNVVIGICPTARHKTKEWLPDRFIALALRLHKDTNAAFLVFGGREDREYCSTIVHQINAECNDTAAINYAGQFSLLETASAMQRCAVIVTNDSGLMHVAAAMKRKVVAIFGSTLEEFGFFPYGTRAIVVERNEVRCRPCSHIGKEECPKKHFRCMNEISVDEVYNACKTLLNEE